ncbi:MAG TPA: NAD(P)/FAD-dependent oxidoreductase [Pseudonocardiaceae bacterium]|jgi:NADH dehydrogenase
MAHRVVIVGGGFAGLFATRALRHRPWRAGGDLAVTLVDRADHHLFQPLLYQCATGILSEGQIAPPLRHVFKRQRNVECVLAEMVDIDPVNRRVRTERPGGEPLELPYDDLLVAAGVQQSYFGHDEFARFAPGMKTIDDALAIRRRVFGAFEIAETATDPQQRTRYLTFALVGAGPTGVELAGQLRELATNTLRDEFRHIRPQDARVLLFDGDHVPLPSFGKKLSAKAAHALDELGVESHMDSMVTHVDADGITVREHSGDTHRYDAGTVLWTAGVAAPPFAAALAAATGATQDHCGRIHVRPDLTIPGHPEISVLGDLMSLDELPGVAEVAMQSGRYAARRIRHRAAGKPFTTPFRYRDVGSAAYIARGKAVVSTGPLHFNGFLGWIAWLIIHIGYLTGFRNRAGALLTWWVTFTLEVRRERAFTTHQIARMRDVYKPDSASTPRG